MDTAVNLALFDSTKDPSLAIPLTAKIVLCNKSVRTNMYAGEHRGENRLLGNEPTRSRLNYQAPP